MSVQLTPTLNLPICHGDSLLFKCGTAKSQNGSFLIKKWQSRSPCALRAPVSLAPIAGSAGSLDLVENMGSHLFHAVQTLNHLGTMANTRSHIHTSFPHTQNRCSLYFIIILSYFLDFPDKVFDFDFCIVFVMHRLYCSIHCVCSCFVPCLVP